MRPFFLPAFIILFLAHPLFAQPLLTLKGIYQDGAFEEKRIAHLQFHPDGRHFTRLTGREIQLFDLGTGQARETLFTAPEKMRLADYQLGPTGRQLLLQTNAEQIYRYSRQAEYVVYDLRSHVLTPLLEQGQQRYAAFSPDGEKVAFVYKNDLYYRDLQKNKVVQVTTDGTANHVINGAADWVYEEEFDLTRAYAWSPDGRYLAFLRFDESAVPSFTLMNYRGDYYPEAVTWKYPKVGQPVSTVTAHIYDLRNGRIQPVELPGADFPYLPRIGWSPDGRVYLFRLNRHQSQLEMWLAAPNGGAEKIISEKDAAYVQLHDNLTFLPDGKGFLWTSERDGWNHIYHYEMNGRLVAQLTRGEWEVSQVLGFDAQNNRIYYQSTEKSPLERHIYSLSVDGKAKDLLNSEAGWHEALFSPDFGHFLHTYSHANRPPSYSINTGKGDRRYWLEENRSLSVLMHVSKTTSVEFWDFETQNGDRLNGWMIKPPGFQKNHPYPVLMYVYGGPGSQRVANRWNTMRDYWWFQLMAQNGYIVACVDNRGTGGRGAKFQKQTYLKLGQYETRDQIEAARYLAGQSYVDPQRIGVYGKSYGGYMASLCLLQGGDVFAAGIALAPVTDWRWYDCVYTERYMRTAEENPDGYRAGAPVNYADQLVDPFLLVHGLGDDNVHFQNSAEMAKALTAANKPFDTHFYPNINHSLRGGNTAIHLYTKMTDFLDEHLRQIRQPSPYDRPYYDPVRVNPNLDKRHLRVTPDMIRKVKPVEKN